MNFLCVGRYFFSPPPILSPCASAQRPEPTPNATRKSRLAANETKPPQPRSGQIQLRVHSVEHGPMGLKTALAITDGLAKRGRPASIPAKPGDVKPPKRARWVSSFGTRRGACAVYPTAWSFSPQQVSFRRFFFLAAAFPPPRRSQDGQRRRRTRRSSRTPDAPCISYGNGIRPDPTGHGHVRPNYTPFPTRVRIRRAAA